MGLFIKGEKLPKYGYNELRVCPNGTLEFRDKTDVLVRIPNAVIEVKEPHGNLIDADALYQKVLTDESEDAYVRFLLRHEPTVIEAEEK